MVVVDIRPEKRNPRMVVVVAIDPDIAVCVTIQPPIVRVITGRIENRSGAIPDAIRRDVSFAVVEIRVWCPQLCVAAGNEQ